jgi:hypothetical protein
LAGRPANNWFWTVPSVHLWRTVGLMKILLPFFFSIFFLWLYAVESCYIWTCRCDLPLLQDLSKLQLLSSQSLSTTTFKKQSRLISQICVMRNKRCLVSRRCSACCSQEACIVYVALQFYNVASRWWERFR